MGGRGLARGREKSDQLGGVSAPVEVSSRQWSG